MEMPARRIEEGTSVGSVGKRRAEATSVFLQRWKLRRGPFEDRSFVRGGASFHGTLSSPVEIVGTGFEEFQSTRFNFDNYLSIPFSEPSNYNHG